jgi:F-type H+-transporting ATPase subunit gamma
VFENAEAPADGKKIIVVVSGDRGLCGGIHSSVTKAARRDLAIADNSQSPLVIIGDKGKAQLTRAAPKNIVLTFNQIGKDIPTFADASAVADLIVKSGVKYDSVDIVYNKYISVISYEAATAHVYNDEALRNSGELFIRTTVRLISLFTLPPSQLQSLRDGGRRNQRLG